MPQISHEVGWAGDGSCFPKFEAIVSRPGLEMIRRAYVFPGVAALRRPLGRVGEGVMPTKYAPEHVLRTRTFRRFVFVSAAGVEAV